MKPIPLTPMAILVAAALAACTRSVPTPAPNLLATQVAATLTAAPTPARTPTPPPTQTPVPSATATLPPSPTITDTPTPGPSPSPTPPPLAADDPRLGLNLAVPDYQDDFKVPYKWIGPDDPTSASNRVEHDTLVAVDHQADHFIWWSTTDQQAGNVYVEVTAAIASCSGKDAAGLAVRVGGDQFDHGYALEFSCQGTFRLRKFIGVTSPPKTLLDWTPAPEINKGPNASNRLGLLAKGAKLYVFANSELIGQTDDSDYASGTFGLYASAEGTANLTVTFTQFALWYPKP